MVEIVTVHIEGLREVEKAMEELSTAVSRRVARKALTAGGEVIAREARALVPVDIGYMRESIDVSTRLTRRQRAMHRKAAPVEMFVGPNDPGAVAEEFGWKDGRPQPYMRPAWDRTRQQALNTIADVLTVEVDKAVARARKKAK